MGPDKERASWFWEPRDAGIARLGTWRFWRTMAVYFCIFSVMGHLVEYPYCWIGLHFFDSVDPGSEVLTNPFKPFFVYGVGIVLCCLVFEPLRDGLLRRLPKPWLALLAFYAVAVLAGMAFELAQGFLQNQPVDGVYPLWDVHDLPGNILGQAWIVNDLFLGLLFTVIVWVVLPPCNWLVARHDEKTATIIFAAVLASTAVLAVITY